MEYRDRFREEKEQKKIKDLINRGILPNSYDVSSSISLIPGHVVDTTERMTVVLARDYGFDPDGYATNNPLCRDIFYRDPYITCSWCNNIMFVNVASLRRIIASPDDGINISPEYTTWCTKCRKSDCFQIGVHDFSKQIHERDSIFRAKFERESTAVRIIQRKYRSRLRRLYGVSLVRAVLAEKQLHYKAATVINSGARGRLGRRQAKTERYLSIIKLAHPLLIQQALRGKGAFKKLYWHTRKDVLDMIYDNYVAYVELTGHQPVRMVVEQNIKDVAERIQQIAYDLLVLIQRQWRGVMARRSVSYFRSEIVRIRQYEVAQAMKIQRAYRGFHCRLGIQPKIEIEKFEETVKVKYISEAEQKRKDAAKKDLDNLVLINYRQERRKEATLRYTSRIRESSHYGGKKMLAYSDSCYGEVYLKHHVEKAVGIARNDMLREEQDHKQRHDRKIFIMKRIAETGPLGFGLRSEPCAPPNKTPISDTSLSQDSVAISSIHTHSTLSFNTDSTRNKSLRVNNIIESSRSRGMRAYFTKELKQIIAQEIEYVTHDYSKKKNLLSRFREYNSSSAMCKKAFKYPANVTDLAKDLLQDEDDDLSSTHAKHLAKGSTRRRNHQAVA